MTEEKNQEPRCQEPKNKGKRKPRIKKKENEKNKISRAPVFQTPLRFLICTSLIFIPLLYSFFAPALTRGLASWLLVL